MKISKILNNLINETLSKKDLQALKNANSSTYPKIPVNAIFYHDVPDIDTILKATKNGNNDITNNDGKNFKLQTVNVKMIIPTQKNVNADNLKTTDKIGANTNAELVKHNQFYFIIDGHHRIANAILQGLDEIDAYVYDEGTSEGINEGVNNEGVIDEDYPQNFNIDEFKELTSFNARIKYCQERLRRISSGSSRIVYQIDDTKVLKLAKNKKGIAQNDVEVGYSGGDYPTAEIFDYHDDGLWNEMELARPLTPQKFKEITGYEWNDYIAVVNNYGNEVGDVRKRTRHKMEVNQSVVNSMWEDNGFVREMLTYIGDMMGPVGDLMRLNSYGVVNREYGEDIVIIDYGLTDDVYDNYYS